LYLTTLLISKKFLIELGTVEQFVIKIFFKFTFLKAFKLTVLIVDGMVAFVKLTQFSNADSQIVLTDEGIVILVKPSQP
jgi:hypothetical protein